VLLDSVAEESGEGGSACKKIWEVEEFSGSPVMTQFESVKAGGARERRAPFLKKSCGCVLVTRATAESEAAQQEGGSRKLQRVKKSSGKLRGASRRTWERRSRENGRRGIQLVGPWDPVKEKTEKEKRGQRGSILRSFDALVE